MRSRGLAREKLPACCQVRRTRSLRKWCFAKGAGERPGFAPSVGKTDWASGGSAPSFSGRMRCRMCSLAPLELRQRGRPSSTHLALFGSHGLWHYDVLRVCRLEGRSTYCRAEQARISPHEPSHGASHSVAMRQLTCVRQDGSSPSTSAVLWRRFFAYGNGTNNGPASTCACRAIVVLSGTRWSRPRWEWSESPPGVHTRHTRK